MFTMPKPPIKSQKMLVNILHFYTINIDLKVQSSRIYVIVNGKINGSMGLSAMNGS